nr:MAG TPA: hypothetical protein [Bacteriophage sp.]
MQKGEIEMKKMILIAGLIIYLLILEVFWLLYGPVALVMSVLLSGVVFIMFVSSR